MTLNSTSSDLSIVEISAHGLGFETVDELAEALGFASAQALAESYGCVSPHALLAYSGTKKADRETTHRYLTIERRLLAAKKTSGLGLYPAAAFRRDFLQPDPVMTRLAVHEKQGEASFTCGTDQRLTQELLRRMIETLQTLTLLRGGYLDISVWGKVAIVGLSEKRMADAIPPTLSQVKLALTISQLGPGPVNECKVTVWVNQETDPVVRDVHVSCHLNQVARGLYNEFLARTLA